MQFKPKCFPYEILGFWYMVGKGCLCGQPTIKTIGAESLLSFLVDFYVCAKTRFLHLAAEGLGAYCVSLPREISCHLALGCPSILPVFPFPLMLLLCVLPL